MKIEIPFESGTVEAELPEGSEILRMGAHAALVDPEAAVRAALADPIGCDSLAAIARRKYRPGAKACVVVSDKTRPVPYRGPGGILLPIVETLRGAGWEARDIAILVATGMHRGMSRAELEKMLGPEPFAAGIEVVNHDCADAACLVKVGRTPRGTEALIKPALHRRRPEDPDRTRGEPLYGRRLGRTEIHLPRTPRRGGNQGFPRRRTHVARQHSGSAPGRKSRARGIPSPSRNWPARISSPTSSSTLTSG